LHIIKFKIRGNFGRLLYNEKVYFIFFFMVVRFANVESVGRDLRPPVHRSITQDNRNIIVTKHEGKGRYRADYLFDHPSPTRSRTSDHLCVVFLIIGYKIQLIIDTV